MISFVRTFSDSVLPFDELGCSYMYVWFEENSGILTFCFVELLNSDCFRGQNLALPETFGSVDGRLPSTWVEI